MWRAGWWPDEHSNPCELRLVEFVAAASVIFRCDRHVRTRNHVEYHVALHIGPRTELNHVRRQRDTAALVRELRRLLDLTQEQFAQKVGVTYSTVNHWENGKRMPQPFLLRRLLEIKEELDARNRRPVKAKSG